jgi:hypothetical protein
LRGPVALQGHNAGLAALDGGQPDRVFLQDRGILRMRLSAAVSSWWTIMPHAIRRRRTLGIVMHDQIIVGKNGHPSFKGLKLI